MIRGARMWSALQLSKADTLRLAGMLLALIISWLNLWKFFIPFDGVALAATLVGGYPMFREAAEAIRERRMTMELSMAIAVIATLCIGQFFTGLVITCFVLFAEHLEHMLVSQGRNVIEALVALLPRRATVRRGGLEVEVEADALVLGDVVIIKPGMRIPVDGAVVKGGSWVDQSSLTGESLPVEKFSGASVFAGTVNQSGILEVNAERIGRDTTFGKIVDVIEQA